eukprot:jgi/Hompol1/6974/HPOL_001687-RA
MQMSSDPKDQIYVALCLTTGAVLIYSVSTGALQYTLSNGHRGPVTAFAFSPDVRRGYSVGEDGLLVEWELKKARMLRTLQSKVKNLTRVAVDHKGQYIAIASNQIDLINIESFKVEKSLSGHATAVVQLEFDASSEYLFSAAADDRFISQWPLASANALPKVYSVETSTKFIALSAAGYLMAVMTNGEVNLWDTNAEHSDASATTAATDATPGKKKKAIARPADCKIVLTHPDNSSTNVPVFNAMFHLDRLLVVYGSALRPLFDRLAFKTDVGKLVPNVSVARHPDPPLSATDNKGATVHKVKYKRIISWKPNDVADMILTNYPYFALRPTVVFVAYMTSPLMRPASDKVVIPFDLTDEITLQERVQALNTGSSDAATGKQDDDGTGAGESSAKAGGASNNKRGKSQKKTATPISLHQMLSQAIQAGDAQMLDKALDVVDKTIVSATVQRMSPVQVITLLELLVVRLQKSPGRASLLIEWIRAVLITHSAYLLSVPNLSSRLGLLYRTLDARQQTLSKLTRLYGRLDLAVSQIERKRLAPAPDEDDAVVVYDDNDDDEGVDEDDG